MRLVRAPAPTLSRAAMFKTPEGEAAFIAAYDAGLAQWPVTYETMYIPTRFGDTHVIATGPVDAAALVLLHAYGTSSTVWIRNIASLSRSYRVYLVDIVGDANKSIYSRPLKAATDGVDWLHDVFDGLGIHQAHLGGWSYGGWLSLQFALAAPDRLQSLVLLAPAASLQPLGLSFYLHFLGPMLFTTQAMVNNTLRWLSSKHEVIDQRLAEQMYLAIKHFRYAPGSYPSVFSDDELRQVRVPTLLLIGDGEVVYNPKSALARAKRLIPEIEADLVPGAGHLLIMEEPALVNQRILDFLGRHTSGPGDAAEPGDHQAHRRTCSRTRSPLA